MTLLPAGQTNGPVNMSITLTVTVYGAGILVAVLPAIDIVSALRQRLIDAEQQAEQSGAPTLNVTMSPLEAGFAMGALGPIACRFCASVRCNLQNAITQQLNALSCTLAG